MKFIIYLQETEHGSHKSKFNLYYDINNVLLAQKTTDFIMRWLHVLGFYYPYHIKLNHIKY